MEIINDAYGRMITQFYGVLVENVIPISPYIPRFPSGDAVNLASLSRLPPWVASLFLELNLFAGEGDELF